MDRFRAGKRLWSKADDQTLRRRYPHTRNREPPNECQADDGGCACPQFSAVVFTVTRG